MLQRFNFIGGQTCPARSGRVLEVIDPADGQPYDTIERSNAADVDTAVAAARLRLFRLLEEVARNG